MKKLFVFTSAVLVSLVSIGVASAHQSHIIDFDQLVSAGSGCPGESPPVRLFFSERTNRLVVGFSEMNLNMEDKSIARKTCTLALPVELPEDKRLVIGDPAIFGKTNFVGDSRVDLQAEVFFAGSTGPVVARHIEGEINGGRRYFYERLNHEISSQCGASTIVRANLSMLGRKAGSSTAASASLDGAALNLRIEDCEKDEEIEEVEIIEI